jgi:hypothetical protein
LKQTPHKIRAAAAGEPQSAEEAMDFGYEKQAGIEPVCPCIFLGFLQHQIDEISAMKPLLPAEVALFIQRPYA